MVMNSRRPSGEPSISSLLTLSPNPWAGSAPERRLGGQQESTYDQVRSPWDHINWSMVLGGYQLWQIVAQLLIMTVL
jgi:hypothetical protein